MMEYIKKILINAVVVFALCHILPGVSVNGFKDAIVVAFALSILNGFVKPILNIISIPITILTLGLFILVIDALIIILADKLIDGFSVSGFFWGLLFSLVMSVVGWFTNEKV